MNQIDLEDAKRPMLTLSSMAFVLCLFSSNSMQTSSQTAPRLGSGWISFEMRHHDNKVKSTRYVAWLRRS